MTYRYIAYSAEKKLVEGKIDVASENLAETALYRAGFENIISLEEVAPGTSIEKLMPTFFSVKPREVIDFSNQLATLIQAGITLSSALKLLEGQVTRKALKKIFSGLIEEIQAGNSLSQALTQYPKIFPNTYCQIIKASEQAGTMEIGLKQAAKYLEKQASANQKIIRAMLYPSFVLILAVFVAILLITVALPPLISLFNSLDVQLPWMTQLLLNISNLLTAHSLPMLAGLVALIILILVLLRLPSVKLARDRLYLKIPLIGKIYIERNMQLFCRTASMLLQAGLRLPQIIDIVIQTNRNQVIRNAFNNVRERLVQGEGLSQPMANNKLFPPLLVEMATVGEKTGTMDATLGTLADFYESEIDRKIDSLISMIEPALTLVIGGVVIFLALSMITPLYSILKSVH
ncbi:MAG: type II secretion system F family protein [Dehalococcoidales bacterium]